MSRKYGYLAAGVGFVGALLAPLAPALASPCPASGYFCGTFTASGTGATDTAVARFGILAGGTLEVILENTSTFGAYHNPDVLTGVFFDIAGSQQALNGSSAVASNIMGWSGPPHGTATLTTGPIDVSNQWGWQYSALGYGSTYLTTGARYGIAASGFSGLNPSFGHSNFNGTSSALQGVDGGVVGNAFTSIAGDPSTTFADNHVVFTFTGLASNITLADISDVTFAYGTNPDGSTPGTTTGTGGGGGSGPGLPVPEPVSGAILAFALASLLVVRRRVLG